MSHMRKTAWPGAKGGGHCDFSLTLCMLNPMPVYHAEQYFCIELEVGAIHCLHVFVGARVQHV